jgi:hypothetical protein
MGACGGKPKAHDGYDTVAIKAATQQPPQPVFARPLCALAAHAVQGSLHTANKCHLFACLLPWSD